MLERVKSVFFTLAAFGLLGYVGYAIAVPIIVYGGAAQTLMSKSVVYVDDNTKLYFAPQCLKDWLRRNPNASSRSLREMTAGDARELRYGRFSCDEPPVGSKLLREMNEEAAKILR